MTMVAKVFDVNQGRKNSKFKTISPNLLPKLNMEEIVYWISMKQQQMIKYRYAIGKGCWSDSKASDIDMSDIEMVFNIVLCETMYTVAFHTSQSVLVYCYCITSQQGILHQEITTKTRIKVTE